MFKLLLQSKCLLMLLIFSSTFVLFISRSNAAESNQPEKKVELAGGAASESSLDQLLETAIALETPQSNRAAFLLPKYPAAHFNPSNALVDRSPASIANFRPVADQTESHSSVEATATPAPIEPAATTAASLQSDDPLVANRATLAQSNSQRLAQITDVTQLSDVQPTDWAYQALQSLVERYGCIEGYPDQTYRGQRALSRYEFAAGVNACLDRISELIAASTEEAISQDDLEALRRLQDDFATELLELRGRLDGLEARLAEIDANQFSTTTVLHGNAIFSVSDVFGEDGGNNTVWQHRENISLISSFSGRDLLLVSLFAGNVPLGGIDSNELYTGSFDLAGTELSADVSGETRTVKASTAEGTLSSQFAATTGDTLQALTLAYSFPVGEQLQVALTHALAPFQLYAPTLNPYLNDFESGTGAISIFGEYNPIYTLAGGGTGAIFNFTPFVSDEPTGKAPLVLTAGYLADGLAVGNPEAGNGLFNGGYAALGQLTWNVTNNFSIAGVYTNEYSPSGRFGFNYNGLGVTGTAVANTLAGQDILGSRVAGERIEAIDSSPVITNAYGVEFNWQPSSTFSISGWFSTFYPRLIGEGDGNILTYALTFAFPDLGQPGNLLGLVVGAEPYLTEMGGDPQDFETDIPWHIEAFYRYRLNDHICLTPGVIWLTAPNQDNDNGDNIIATLRTTFLF